MLSSILNALFGGSIDFQALDELAAKYSQVSIEAFFEQTYTGLDRPPERERWVVKRNGDKLLREIYPLGGKTEFATIALATGGRAVQSEQHAAGWNVFSLYDDGDFANAMEYVWQYVEAPWSVLGIPLKDLVTEPGFKIVSIEPVGELMQVEFAYQPPEGVVRAYRSGTLTMNPKRSWAIERTALQCRWGDAKGTITQMMQYDGTKLIALTAILDNETTKMSSLREINFETEFGPPPAEAFDPANYGVLPSPHPWDLPLPWMFAGLSAVCIALAVWLRRRA